ncbi:hypothetical protein QR680_016109 [Steinernema hermaphroditum]|uniref:Uncharacterized protein n=1 Tax=Steinernema hermaphroditum TaxID=289476 RepID=A0AA39HA36_9BILA|nr:hypothetical protein QR680_016109 [Steinernema hermaphroditum]
MSIRRVTQCERNEIQNPFGAKEILFDFFKFPREGLVENNRKCREIASGAQQLAVSGKKAEATAPLLRHSPAAQYTIVPECFVQGVVPVEVRGAPNLPRWCHLRLAPFVSHMRRVAVAVVYRKAPRIAVGRFLPRRGAIVSFSGVFPGLVDSLQRPSVQSTVAFSMNPHPSDTPYGFPSQPYPPCSTFASTSSSAFPPQFPPRAQTSNSYYNFSKQCAPHSIHRPPSSQDYSSPGRVQQFQHSYPNKRNTQAWVSRFHNGLGCSPGPGSGVSSYNSSPAHSVISHVSRYSTASQLTVVTNISPVAYCGNSLSVPGNENIDPQHELKTLPVVINQLHANFHTKALPVEQVVRFLQTVTQSASQYSVVEQKRSRLAEFVDRGTLQRLFEYILATSGEILPRDSSAPVNDPFQVLRRVWKLMFFLSRCDVSTEALLQMKGMASQLVHCLLHAIRVGMNHSPYVVLVFRRLLESRHGAEFRQSARIGLAVERLLAYLPYCHTTMTPTQSSIASGNKFDVITCFRLLVTPEVGTRREADSTVRKKFVEAGGVEAMLHVMREDVEEPVLSSASGTLKAIVKTKGSEKIAERMVRLGALQILAARLDHGSPVLVQNCLMCMANICDQKAALATQSLETAITHTVAVLGSTEIRIDQFATGFLVNVCTIARLKEFVVRCGAVRALLQITSQHAFTFFNGKLGGIPSKPYVDALDNSVRTIAYLSHGISDPSVVRQLLHELTTFDDALNLFKNILKADPPPDSLLSRSARKFRFLTRENHLQLRRHVLLIVQRNVAQFRWVNPFADKLRAFAEAFIFPQTAFEMLFELTDALRYIHLKGNFGSRSTNEERQEIAKLLANVVPNLIHEFSRMPEFADYIAVWLKDERFANFLDSIKLLANEQMEIKLIDFCATLCDSVRVSKYAPEAFDMICTVIEQSRSGTVNVVFAYDRLLATVKTDEDRSNISGESMDFSS